MITQNIKRESKFTHLASILRFIHPADSGFEKAQFLGDLVNTERKERQAFLNLTGFMWTYAQKEHQHWWQQHNALPIKKRQQSKRVEIYESTLQFTLSIASKETFFLLWDIRSELTVSYLGYWQRAETCSNPTGSYPDSKRLKIICTWPKSQSGTKWIFCFISTMAHLHSTSSFIYLFFLLAIVVDSTWYLFWYHPSQGYKWLSEHSPLIG